MTRRIKRMREFDVTLDIKSDDFIHTPRPAQRNWMLNRAMGEMADNLKAMHEVAGQMVPGNESLSLHDREQAELSDEQIMEDWQLPLMQAMAESVTENHGHLLEIGFGRGAASSMIQRCGVASHTIIECNEHVIQRYHQWRGGYADKSIRMEAGLWQDVLPGLGRYDSIFFHTYPLNEAEMVEQIGESTTFAEHFFEHAAAHLNEGGRFTYLSNEVDSLGREHQRRLLQHFSTVQLSRCGPLDLPDNVRDAWWAPTMIVVCAIK